MTTEPTTSEIDYARSRVTVGSVPPWVVMYPLDEGWQAPGGAPYSVILQDRQVHAEEKAGFRRMVHRLETLHAVHEASQWKFDFDPATQQVVLHTIAVRRPGFSAEHARFDKLRFLQREASLEALALDGWVTLLLLLDDVRMGDIIEISLTVIGHPRLHEQHLWEMDSPPQTPAHHWRWSVISGAERPVRWKSSGVGMDPKMEDLPDFHRRWTWAQDDYKAPEPEAGTPSWHLSSPWLQVSDFASWGEVAAETAGRWIEDFDHPDLQRFVDEICAAEHTLAARVAKALTLVQDDIRYLSLNIELGGQIPTAAGQVLRRRFGDCKDKSFLLAHALRCLGVSARPVLVHTTLRKALSDLLPGPTFNHVVVEYELDGRRYWADPTIPFQGGDAKTRWIPNYMVGLPIGPDVEALEAQPVPPPQGSLTLHEQFALDERVHRSRMAVFYTATGREADALRSRLMMGGTGKFADERELFYRQFFPLAKVIRQPEWQDDRARNRLQCALVLELPQTGALSSDGKLSTFQYSAHLVRATLPVPDAGKRFAPLQLDHGARYEHIIELLNTQHRAELDSLTEVKHNAFDFRGINGNRAKGHVMHFKIHVNRELLRPSELLQFRERLAQLWAATAVELIVSSGRWQGLGYRSSDPLLPKPKESEAAPAAAAPITPEPKPAEPMPALRPSSLASPPPAEVVRRPMPKIAEPLPPLAPSRSRRSDEPYQGTDQRPRSSGRRRSPSVGSRRRRASARWNSLMVFLLFLLLLGTAIACVYFLKTRL